MESGSTFQQIHSEAISIDWIASVSNRRRPSQRALKKLSNQNLEMLDKYVAAKERMRFKCLICGDIVAASLNRMTGDRPVLCKCKKDKNLARRRVEKVFRYKEIAKSRGGKFLSNPEFIDEREKYLWRCASGHEWKSTTRSVIGAGSWCPICAGNAPRKLEELVQVIKARGGVLLDTKYRGVEASHAVQCSLGHKFTNQFKKIVDSGQWCPICSKSSKSEELARTTMEQIFESEFPKVRPKWLKNARGNQMELDGYSTQLQLAFEYQGIQHFREISAFQVNLKQRMEDDELKKQLCKKYGVRLFILDYKTPFDEFPIKILQQAINFGIEDDYNFEKQIDFDRAYIRDDRIEELRTILAIKEIRLISSKWIDTDTKYEMECLVCGNHWRALGSAFFNSRRVAGCKTCAMKQLQESNSGNLKGLRDFAKSYGGIVLSTEYSTASNYYQFRCKEGHEFRGKLNNMKSRRQFCPECENRQKREPGTEEVALKRIKERGLVAIGKFESFDMPFLCRCLNCGEASNVVISHLKQGIKGCPYCSGKKTRERDAMEVLKELGFKPIEKFPGGSKPWAIKCVKCEKTRNVVLSTLKFRGKPCGHKGTGLYVLKKSKVKSETIRHTHDNRKELRRNTKS